MPTPSHGRPRRRLLITIAVLLALAAAAAAHPPTVLANTFTVHSCQTPSGTWTGMDGWTSAGSGAVQGEDYGVATSCTDESTHLKLEFGGTQLPVGPGKWVRWTFEPPASLTIRSLELIRSIWLGWPVVPSTYGRPYVYDAWHDGDVPENQLEFHFPPWNDDTAGVNFPSELIEDDVRWRSLSVRLRCWDLMGDHNCAPFPASVTIPRAEIGLADVVAPTATPTGGALAGATPVRGAAALAFHATDQGGGVYRVALAVDGDEVARHVVDDQAGTCGDVEPANDDPYEFGAPQPCPLAADGTVQLDTATLEDGRHHVVVTVEDAAGNVDVAFDGAVQTHNAPIGTAAPSLHGQATVAGQLTAAPGQWDGTPTDFDYRWLRCDAQGGACDPVAGESGPAYALDEADAYHRIRVEVTAANDSGSAVAQSAPSAVVADAAGSTTPPGGGRGSDGGRDGSGGGGGDGTPAPRGIQGLANPLAQQPGHVANGASATTRARIVVGAQRADGGTAKRVLVRHGRRVAIVGRLLDAAGAGIGGARVGAAWKVAGRRWIARSGVTTRSDGRFTYRLPPGASRAVRFAYYAFSDSRTPTLSTVVQVDVRAPLAIAADRRRVDGDRVVRLSGRVAAAGAVPRAGALLTLQGFQRGWGWRTFRSVRTDRRGRWSTTYRFRLSSGRFGFRAVLPGQPGVPFAAGTSKPVFVVVG